VQRERTIVIAVSVLGVLALVLALGLGRRADDARTVTAGPGPAGTDRAAGTAPSPTSPPAAALRLSRRAAAAHGGEEIGDADSDADAAGPTDEEAPPVRQAPDDDGGGTGAPAPDARPPGADGGAVAAPAAPTAADAPSRGDRPSPSAREAGRWRLAWSDHFSGPTVDTDRWLLYEGAGNGGVGLRRPSAITQADGELRITGRGDVSGGMSSRAPQTYGRWEVRARVDRGNGYAPAILLWPASNRWPEEGEIDLAEIPLGDRAESHTTVHWGADNSQVGSSVRGDFTRWHTFAVEWLPDRITAFVDGREVFDVRDPAAIPRTPMNLAIQHDVGPFDWIPGRDADTPAEVSLRVDWVRVFRR
jgi:hypothetical protein